MLIFCASTSHKIYDRLTHHFRVDTTLVTGGYSQLTTAAANEFQQLDLADYIVEQDGYIFIYTTNESPQLSEVFFDEMTVTHEKLVPDEAYDPGYYKNGSWY